MSSSNNTLKGDENFLKEFLKDFYRQVIKIENYTKFENILMDWIQDYFINNNNEKNLENVHIIMSHNQFENFNGLEINLCKDEINTMEKYFKSLDKGSNENQKDYDVKRKELEKLNNLGYCYQYGLGKKKDNFKAFE